VYHDEGSYVTLIDLCITLGLRVIRRREVWGVGVTHDVALPALVPEALPLLQSVGFEV